MKHCQCLIKSGRQCSREPITKKKASTDQLIYCWQHQNCLSQVKPQIQKKIPIQTQKERTKKKIPVQTQELLSKKKMAIKRQNGSGKQTTQKAEIRVKPSTPLPA